MNKEIVCGHHEPGRPDRINPHEPWQIQMLGPDHPDTLRTRNKLAFWRGQAGDPAAAAVAAERLTDQLRVLGPDDPDTRGIRALLAHWRGQGQATGHPFGPIPSTALPQAASRCRA